MECRSNRCLLADDHAALIFHGIVQTLHISLESNLFSVPRLNLDVRPCEDGILVYDNTARATHLIHPAAWDLFVSLSQSNSALARFDPGELDAGNSRLAMVNALERAGLIMRC